MVASVEGYPTRWLPRSTVEIRLQCSFGVCLRVSVLLPCEQSILITRGYEARRWWYRVHVTPDLAALAPVSEDLRGGQKNCTRCITALTQRYLDQSVLILMAAKRHVAV